MKELIIEDTLLFISVALAMFGVGILESAFYKGIIALCVSAIIFFGRTYLKKQELLKREKLLVDKITQPSNQAIIKDK